MQPEIKVRDYDLPDINILHNYQPGKEFFLWQPDLLAIVLGRSNKAEKALNPEHVLADQVPVFKRSSGGESVILSPESLVVSAVGDFKTHKKPADFFKYCNNIIIGALEQMDVKNLGQKGISDISIGEKKILGSSMYKHPERWFYHAVLNIGIDPELIGRYLAHPSREPDYRLGRKHEDFVTSLQKEGYKIDITELKQKIARGFLL